MEQEELAWRLPTGMEFAEIGRVSSSEIRKLVRAHLPDLEEMFAPYVQFGVLSVEGVLGNGWIAVRLSAPGGGMPAIGNLSPDEVKELSTKILPFSSRSYSELVDLLGPRWFGYDRSTYVGRYDGQSVSWVDIQHHLLDWLNHLVVPEMLKRNRDRIMRAIPTPPQFDIERIRQALWVLESEESMTQGTAFHLEGVGFVTCAHVITPGLQAFRPSKISQKYPVSVIAQSTDLDIAIIDLPISVKGGLSRGTADILDQMSHLVVAGFPNYRLGDTGIITPGIVVGFRPVHGIRRILTNAPIIAGMSGGPVLDGAHRVIGLAVTGADRMEIAHETEDHGIIPIDILSYLPI